VRVNPGIGFLRRRIRSDREGRRGKDGGVGFGSEYLRREYERNEEGKREVWDEEGDLVGVVYEVRREEGA